MQFLSYVLFQLDEACRYINDGRLAQLRVALLLLDNAAEIQLARCAEQHLMHETMRERIRALAVEIPKDKRGEDLEEITVWQPLTYSEKRAIDRNYDDKIRYLSERVNQLDTRLTKPLSHLHKYRNEAYHKARVRKQTIETAVRLLLDINCELLFELSRGFTSYASDGDYSWIEQRFGADRLKLFRQDDLIRQAVHEFRSRIQLDDRKVCDLLKSHLVSRAQDTLDALGFIVENTRFPDQETAVRESYGFNMAQRKQEGIGTQDLVGTESQHNVGFVLSIQQRSQDIVHKSDKLQAFDLFARLETEYEPVEDSVRVLASEVDNQIQMAIDIARGK
jgi:hypothetical protein